MLILIAFLASAAALVSMLGHDIPAVASPAAPDTVTTDTVATDSAATPLADNPPTSEPAPPTPPRETQPPTSANDFIPEERDLTSCIGVLERPGCGSESRGGWRQTLILLAIFAGLAVVFGNVARGVQRNRREQQQQQPQQGG